MEMTRPLQSLDEPGTALGRRVGILMAYAGVGWVLCAAAMGALMAILSQPFALRVHLVVAPLLGAVLAAIYFRRRDPLPPHLAAAAIVGTIGLLDLLVVALLVLRSLDMFRSPIGTWIPLGLMAAAIWTVGAARIRALRRAPKVE